MQYNAKNGILIWAILSGSTVNFCLEMMFGMLFFIVWAIQNQKNPKKVCPSVFDFDSILAL